MVNLTQVRANWVLRLVARVDPNSALTGLFADRGNAAAEKQVMVVQTIHACCTHYRKGRGLFSVRGPGVLNEFRRCGAKNATAYRYLLCDGYFVEGVWGEHVTVIPTFKLLRMLDSYLFQRERKTG